MEMVPLRESPEETESDWGAGDPSPEGDVPHADRSMARAATTDNNVRVCFFIFCLQFDLYVIKSIVLVDF
jgi:hypothetical protein